MAAQPTDGPMPTYTPYPTYTPHPTFTPVPPTATPTETPTNTPTPDHVVIDTMDSISGWSTFSDPESTIKIGSAPGKIDDAIEISYNLTVNSGNWVLISRPVDLQPLSGTTRGIRFFYKGSGEHNSIELKLLYAPDPTGQSITFVKLWPAATVTEGWHSFEVRYAEFNCGETCPATGQLDLEEVRAINLAITNAEGGASGSGIVIIDHVVGFR
jgi:hypothetical protein